MLLYIILNYLLKVLDIIHVYSLSINYTKALKLDTRKIFITMVTENDRTYKFNTTNNICPELPIVNFINEQEKGDSNIGGETFPFHLSIFKYMQVI